MTDRWCKHCDGWGWILHPYGRPAEKCNCGGPYRGGESNEVSDTLACDDAISAARELIRQHEGIRAERRAREMNAELPCETRAMMQLKGMM